MITDEELAEIKHLVAECENGNRGHYADSETPYCEGFGCMDMRKLLDKIDELKADRDEWMRMAGRLASAKKVASREKERA